MSGYIKHFENGGENISFEIEEESVYLYMLKFGIKLKTY